MSKIDAAVNWALQIANNPDHGYDQEHRDGPDYDCSSFVANALAEGGFPINRKSTTFNLRQQLLNCGFTYCVAPYRRGDIHLVESHHVCMQVDNLHIVEARLNEKGKIVGGETGDQDGKEIWVRDYYDYKTTGWSSGWEFHLRAPEISMTDRIAHLQAACLVLNGHYGDGEDRKTRLAADGYDYNAVQAIVNYICRLEW